MKVIWVVGTPNGGTSCVAGILHHLGVDMGDVSLEPTNREYVVFEDRRLNEYKAKNFRGYLAMRINAAGGLRRVGVKCGAWYWMEDPSPETLPVQVVMVDRPVEDSMRSSLRRHHADTRPLNELQEVRHKVGGIGEAWAAKVLLQLKIEPALRVEFRRLLADPRREVERIAARLRLDPRQSQLAQAADFVNPALRHI